MVLVPPCLTLSIIRVKWSNPGKGVAPSPSYWKVVAIEKGAFGSPSTTVANFTYSSRESCLKLSSDEPAQI